MAAIPSRLAGLLPVSALVLASLSAGCLGGDGTGASSAELSLPTADGTVVAAESLRCIYRQAIGADDTLSLQLQFLQDPDHVAFAIYVDDPRPAMPYEGAAGEDSRFSFEAFVNDTGYAGELRSGEIVVHLDRLPSPARLRDGQELPLRGTLELTTFTVPATHSFGATNGPAALELAPGGVPIACTATFATSLVLD